MSRTTRAPGFLLDKAFRSASSREASNSSTTGRKLSMAFSAAYCSTSATYNTNCRLIPWYKNTPS